MRIAKWNLKKQSQFGKYQMTTTVCAQDVYGIMGCVRLLGNKPNFLEAIDVRSCVFVAHMKKQACPERSRMEPIAGFWPETRSTKP